MCTEKPVKLSTFIVRVWENENTRTIPRYEKTVEAVSYIGALNKSLRGIYGARVRNSQKIVNAKVINATDGQQKSFAHYSW